MLAHTNYHHAGILKLACGKRTLPAVLWFFVSTDAKLSGHMDYGITLTQACPAVLNKLTSGAVHFTGIFDSLCAV